MLDIHHDTQVNNAQESYVNKLHLHTAHDRGKDVLGFCATTERILLGPTYHHNQFINIQLLAVNYTFHVDVLSLLFRYHRTLIS